jgi:hypothetical protein
MTSRYLHLLAAGVSLLVSDAGCVSREPGATVQVTAMSHALMSPRAAWTSSSGYNIQLDQLFLVLGRVELVPCSAVAPAMSRLRALFGPAVAHAHGANTPTKSSVPNVLAPLVDDTPVTVATLQPPAVAYCSLRVTLEAADADAERMPAELDMNGLSMFITGSYGASEQTAGVSFRYESIVSATRDLPFVDGAGNATVVTLSEDNLLVTLQVDLSFQRWFDGLALFPGSFSSLGDIVLSQALDHAAVVVLDDLG